MDLWETLLLNMLFRCENTCTLIKEWRRYITKKWKLNVPAQKEGFVDLFVFISFHQSFPLKVNTSHIGQTAIINKIDKQSFSVNK